MFIWPALSACMLVFSCLVFGRVLIHYFQLESYQFPGYFRTIRRNLKKASVPGMTLGLIWISVVLLSAAFLPAALEWVIIPVLFVAFSVSNFIIRRKSEKNHEKKPLVFTSRIKRLVAVCAVLWFILLYFFFVLSKSSGLYMGKLNINFFSVLFLLFPVFLPVWVALGGLLAWPLEKLISELYFRDAQRMLKQRNDLIRIGITGSWGKTSVKFILGTILGEKYHTLITPASFNTPMGVTKVIRTKLEPSHRVFIAEMGARHVGDIREMCRLVSPEIGVLTSIGPQHLDTFKTLDRIIQTKCELIDKLPENGTVFIGDDEGICRDVAGKTDKKHILAGLDPGHDQIWAEHIVTGKDGSSFDLCTKEFRVPCHTALLGELNIRNIVLAAAVGIELGLTGKQIASGIGKLKPVEHRIQLIPNPGGITIIDDAFNSNIRGAEQAFRTLHDFPSRRIVVTPGMVELGQQEESMNESLGQSMAENCDTAVLVGKKRAVSIQRGLLKSGFPPEEIYIVQSLDEATTLLGQIAKSGDTVLFENDLPDNYKE